MSDFKVDELGLIFLAENSVKWQLSKFILAFDNEVIQIFAKISIR